MDERVELKTFPVGLFSHQVDRTFDGCAQVEIDTFDGELARLDLREIEDIVDNGEKGIGA